MVETIKCAAAVAFTRYISGFGMVHGDPENNQANTVNVPEHAIEGLFTDGCIKRPKGFKTAAEIAEVEAAAEAAAPGSEGGSENPPA